MEASHPESGTLHAWIEGELDSAEHERIAAHIAECARCREAVAEARGLIAGASRIVSALDGAPAGVIPSRRRFGAPRQRFVPARWAAAAAVLLFAATSVVVSREFTSRGAEVPSALVDAAARSEEGLAEPAAAPATSAEAPSPTVANVPQAGRSGATSPREPTATVSGDQARTRRLRDRAASELQPRSVYSRSADAAENRVTAEADFAGKGTTGESAGQIAPTAPTLSAPAPPPAPPPMALGAVVVTGAAAARAAAGNVRVVRVVRYEARPGVIVTLTEYEEPPRSDQPAIVLRGGARPQAAAAPPEVRELSGRSSIENAYMWQHPDGGRTYVLRGPLPRAELESLARRLSELKVVR